MSTGSTPSLPPALAGQKAKAAIQAVAVRLISAPSGLQNNATPVKINGTVTGQQPSGALEVQTERGIVELMLNDKQSLPKGMRIEIDIPAGKSPNSAFIRASNAEAAPPPPSLQATSQAQARTPATSLERNTNLNNQTLETVLQSRNATPQTAAASVATGDLELGQFVRLTPLPPTATAIIQNSSAAGTQVATQITAQATPQILQALVTQIQSLPSTETALRPQLLNILGRIAIPPALRNSPEPAAQNLIQNISNLLQATESQKSLPVNLQTATSGSVAGSAASVLPNVPRSFNPTVPIDVQILGFQAQSPVSGTSSSSPFGNSITLPLPSSASAGNAAPSSPVTLIITANTAPPSGNASNAAAHSAQSVVTVAQIVGQTSQGLPIVSIPAPTSGLVQNYVMQFGAQNIAVPAELAGQIGPQAGSSSGASPVITSPILLSVLPQTGASQNMQSAASTWSSLQDMLLMLQDNAAISGASSAAAHQFAAMMPSAAQPQNLGALALFFLAMVRTGDVESWMPQNTLDLLRQTARGAGALKGMADDLSGAARTQGGLIAHDWRGVMIPLLWEQHIHKVPLYYKELPDDEETEEQKRKKKRLRFLFDLNLSRMGGVQVDGFMESKRLDLILRTKSPLSRPMQSKMKQLYAGAVERSHLTGELSFQFKPENWVDLSNEPAPVGVNA